MNVYVRLSYRVGLVRFLEEKAISMPLSGISIRILPVVLDHEILISAAISCKILTLSACCRKKRKWDQPAEFLVSAGVAVPGVLPLGNMGPLGGIALPGVAPVSSTLLMNSLGASCATIPQVFQASSMQQHTAIVVPKVSHIWGYIHM